MTATRLDLRGLRCPLPALRGDRALDRMAVDETLELICDDPLAVLDIPHMVAERDDARITERRGMTFWILKTA